MKTWDFINRENDFLCLLKKLRRYYRNETAYSITFKKWSKADVTKMLVTNMLPGLINDIVNIEITLENHFGMDRNIAIAYSIKIHKKRKRKIRDYMVNWFDIHKSNHRDKSLSPKRALNEQIARGFVKIENFNIDPDLPYIRSNVARYIWPKQWGFSRYSNMGKIYEKLPKIGVRGYTGITLPKRLYK